MIDLVKDLTVSMTNKPRAVRCWKNGGQITAGQVAIFINRRRQDPRRVLAIPRGIIVRRQKNEDPKWCPADESFLLFWKHPAFRG